MPPDTRRQPGRRGACYTALDAALTWTYEVIRLWDIPAETLLAQGPLAVLPLVGQTRLTHPEVILPAVVARLQDESNAERRRQIITSLLALMAEEEWARMVERLVEEDWLLEISPYLQRIRAEGRAAGVLSTRQQDIGAFLEARFALDEAGRQRLEEQLSRVIDEPTLARLLTVAARCTSVEAFLEVCAGASNAPGQE